MHINLSGDFLLDKNTFIHLNWQDGVPLGQVFLIHERPSGVVVLLVYDASINEEWHVSYGRNTWVETRKLQYPERHFLMLKTMTPWEDVRHHFRMVYHALVTQFSLTDEFFPANDEHPDSGYYADNDDLPL